MARLGLRGLLLVASVAVCLGGCKSNKSCTAGARECVDDRAALVCPSDGSGSVTVTCRADETCSGGSCVATGGCTAGSRECLDDNVARVCDSTGTTWIAEPCDATQLCSSGTCVLNRDAGVICAPGATECIDNRLSRVCTPDGTEWVVEACAAAEICANGQCGPNTNTGCVPFSGACVNGAAAVCKVDGTGYTITACPGSSICTSGGVCQGAACTVGTRCSTNGNLRSCADGTSVVETACPQGQSCIDPDPTHGAAACKTNQCTAGTRVCGNKLDTAADQTKYYSECMLTADGYRWAITKCDGYLTCGSGVVCTSTCVPGKTQCVTVLGGTGVSTCGTDGNWGVPVACGSQTCGTNATTGVAACADPGCETGQKGVCSSPGMVRLCTNGTLGPEQALTCTTGVCTTGECAPQCTDGATKCLTLANGDSGVVTCASRRWPTTTVGELCYSPTAGTPNRTCYTVSTTRAVCADPECSSGQHGACTADGKIRECIDGKLATLSAAVDCPAGQICTGTACASAACTAGETVCAGSPVYNGYRTCQNGSFSPQITFCPSAGDAGVGLQGCTDTVGAGSLRTALCGLECTPGTRACQSVVQDGGTSIAKLRICDSTGKWGAATTCPYGDCTGSSPNAGCQADCLPGQVRCAGPVVSHPDMHINVYSGMQSCSSSGLWDTTTNACTTGQYCRTNSSSVAYGCVECVGTANEYARVDIRCSGTNAIQECTLSNTWSSTIVSCNGGTCTQPTASYSAYCPTTGPYGGSCLACAMTTCATTRSACIADATCNTYFESCVDSHSCWSAASFWSCASTNGCTTYMYSNTPTYNYAYCLEGYSPPTGCYSSTICY
jgi:hypothetical protein